MQTLGSLFGKRGPQTTQLHRAAEAGDISAVRILVQRSTSALDDVNEDHRTPLHCAANNGHDVVVGELLDRHARSILQDKDGNTPLHLASLGGHNRCVQHLLGVRNKDPDKGSLPALRNSRGYTALLVAAESGHTQVVQEILRANPTAVAAYLDNCVSAVHLAALRGHLNTLMLLQAAQVNLESTTLDRHTPLHYACQGGHMKVVVWLLQNGVKPDTVSLTGKSPLDLAREGGHHHVTAYLKECLGQSTTPPRAESPLGAVGPSPNPQVPAGSSLLVPPSYYTHAPVTRGSSRTEASSPLYPPHSQENYKYYPSG